MIVLTRQRQKKWSRVRPVQLPIIASRSPLRSFEQMVYLVKGNADIGKIWQTFNYRPNLTRPTTVLDSRPCTDEKGVLTFKVIRAIYNSEIGLIAPTMTEMADLKLVITGIKRDNLSEYQKKRKNNLQYPKTSIWELDAFVFQPPNRARPDNLYAELPYNDYSRLKTWSKVILSYDSARAHGVMMLQGQDLPFTMQKHFLCEKNCRFQGTEDECHNFEVMEQKDTFSSKTVYLVRDISDLDLNASRRIPIRVSSPNNHRSRT